MNILMNSELDLFQEQHLANNILKTEEIQLKPITSFNDQQCLEFACSSQNDSYIDLGSACLKLLFQVVKKNGENIKSMSNETKKIGIENCILHTLIKQVNLSLNGKIISSSDNCYAYRAFVETVLSFSEESKNSQLKCIGWSDELNPDEFNENDGYVERCKMIEESKIVELFGKLHCDVMNQPLLLTNNVDLRISIALNNPEFYMLCEDENDTSFIKVIDASIYLKTCAINPKVLIAHAMMLEKQSMKYFYKKVEIKPFTISAGGNNVNLFNIAIGQIPTLLIFFMVKNENFIGKRTKSCLNLSHNFISSIALTLNSTQIPLDPIVMDFKNDISARAYSTLFTANNTFYTHASNLITKEMFGKGYFMIVFNLENFNSVQSYGISNQGNLSLKASFSESIKSPLTCFTYLQYDACLEIDKNRNIILN